MLKNTIIDNQSISFNKHFLSVLTTKNLQMFSYDEENSLQLSAEIIEHVNRLLEISDTHHFYIDEDAFKAFGSAGFPQRFTRVFIDDNKFEYFERGKFYRVHKTSELKRSVQLKDHFSPETKIFFIGNAEFMRRASTYCNKLLLTVVDKYVEPTNNELYEFPLEIVNKHFSKRKDIEPEMLKMIMDYKKKMKKQQESKFEIADNGMKIFRNEPETDATYDAILDTPNYFFYEYTR